MVSIFNRQIVESVIAGFNLVRKICIDTCLVIEIQGDTKPPFQNLDY